MALPEATLSALWNRASAAEIGIGIKTNEPKQLRNMLYILRTKVKDPEWEKLIIFMPANGEVWLVKKTAELPE